MFTQSVVGFTEKKRIIRCASSVCAASRAVRLEILVCCWRLVCCNPRLVVRNAGTRVSYSWTVLRRPTCVTSDVNARASRIALTRNAKGAYHVLFSRHKKSDDASSLRPEETHSSLTTCIGIELIRQGGIRTLNFYACRARYMSRCAGWLRGGFAQPRNTCGH